MKRINVYRLSLSAMFLALMFILPLLTGQIPQLGERFCPMHIPVFLCGYLCSGPWALAVGFIGPLLRSLTVGVPAPFFPKAVAIAFELATYGLVSGISYKLLPKKKINLYLSLVISMVAGRIIRGIVQLCFVGLNVAEFDLSAYWTVVVVNALPGIIIQLILIPVLVSAVEKYRR